MRSPRCIGAGPAGPAPHLVAGHTTFLRGDLNGARQIQQVRRSGQNRPVLLDPKDNVIAFGDIERLTHRFREVPALST